MSLSRCISYYMSFYYKRYKLREAAVPSLMTVCTKETLNYASLLKSYVLIFIVTSKPLALGGASIFELQLHGNKITRHFIFIKITFEALFAKQVGINLERQRKE